MALASSSCGLQLALAGGLALEIGLRDVLLALKFADAQRELVLFLADRFDARVDLRGRLCARVARQREQDRYRCGDEDAMRKWLQLQGEAFA